MSIGTATAPEAYAGYVCLAATCVHVLQNDKRQLETAMVVESRIAMKQKGLSKRSLGDTEDSYVASEVSLAHNEMQFYIGNLPNLARLQSMAGQAHAGPAMTSPQCPCTLSRAFDRFHKDLVACLFLTVHVTSC